MNLIIRLLNIQILTTVKFEVEDNKIAVSNSDKTIENKKFEKIKSIITLSNSNKYKFSWL